MIIFLGKQTQATIDEILTEYELTMDDITGGSRKDEIALIRGLLAYVLYISGLTFQAVGLALGGLHHSTIIYHYRKFDSLVHINYMPLGVLERSVMQTARKYYKQLSAV
jgi:chromosomal replication initiation ATPase DnaA